MAQAGEHPAAEAFDLLLDPGDVRPRAAEERATPDGAVMTLYRNRRA